MLFVLTSLPATGANSQIFPPKHPLSPASAPAKWLFKSHHCEGQFLASKNEWQ